MNAAAKLGAFAVAIAAAVGIGAAFGNAVGPIGDDAPHSPAMDMSQPQSGLGEPTTDG